MGAAAGVVVAAGSAGQDGLAAQAAGVDRSEGGGGEGGEHARVRGDRFGDALASGQACADELAGGFAGAVLIFTPWQTTSGLVSAGALECLAASVSYAISYIYMDRFLARQGLSAIVLSACQLAAAAVMLAVALAVTGVRTPHVTAESVAAIVVLGVIGTGFAYVLNYQIITSEGATVASTVTYLLPVVAIVLGVLVLGESITVTVLAGIALVLAGVALTRHRPKPATDEPQVE